MSTRCMAIVRSKELYGNGNAATVEVARIYRHCDGYPEGMGMDIAEAARHADEWHDKNNRNWAQPFLHALLGMDADMELCGPTEEHPDIDYLYVVTAVRDVSWGKVAVDAYKIEIAVYRATWDAEGYAELMREKPMFVGDWREFEREFSTGPTRVLPSAQISISTIGDNIEAFRLTGTHGVINLPIDRDIAIDDVLLAIEKVSGVSSLGSM